MSAKTPKIFDVQQGKLKSLAGFILFLFTKPGRTVLKKYLGKVLKGHVDETDEEIAYADQVRNMTDPATLKKEFDAVYPQLKFKEGISILLAVNDPAMPFLAAAVDTVRQQLSPDWELLLINNCPGHAGVNDTLQTYAAADDRIRIIQNSAKASLAACYNTALMQASQMFVLFLPESNLLTPNCIFEIIRFFNSYYLIEMIYADDDLVDAAGNYSDPYFKPNWSPDTFLSRNYIGASFAMKRSVIEGCDYFSEGYDDCLLYELLLRVTGRIELIGHIPKVLFHNRQPAGAASTSLQKQALAAAMKRRGLAATIHDIPGAPDAFRIKYEVQEYRKVSIIIPSRDQVTLLKATLDSIIEKTDYPDYEIILLNNNSRSTEFHDLVYNFRTRNPDNFRFVEANFPFNFARLMNLGVAESYGDYILLLNNDVEVTQSDWITNMVSYAQQERIGAVGVKLLYPDNTIQHAGIVLGINGEAGHAFIHQPADADGYYHSVKAATNYTAVTAACLMCRKELYSFVGGMSELFAVEFNDIDLCLRFCSEPNHFNVYLPDVVLYHHESASRGHPFRSKASWQLHEKELKLLKQFWKRWVDNDPNYNPNLTLRHTDFRRKMSA